MGNLALCVILVVILIIVYLYAVGARVGVVLTVLAFAIAAIVGVYVDYARSARSANTANNALTAVTGSADVPKLKIYMRDIMRNAKNGLKSALAGVGIAASGGMAGDTIVEIFLVVLDAALYMGQIAATFLSDSADYSKTMRRIYDLDFANGVDGIRDGMDAIVRDLGGPSSAAFEQIRGLYAQTIEWLLSMLGTAISMAVPDDAGTVGWGLSEMAILAIRTGSTSVFWIVRALYNALPKTAREFIQSPAQLGEAATYAIKLIETYVLHNGKDGWLASAGKLVGRSAVLTGVAATLLLLQPVLMLPVAGAVFVGSQFLSMVSSTGFGSKIVSKAMQSLYNTPVHIPGIGDMTPVEAMVLFVSKITVLTFAGLYILSGATNVEPEGFVAPTLKPASAPIEVPAPARAAGVPDPVDAEMNTIKA